jgi:hypothetical protein
MCTRQTYLTWRKSTTRISNKQGIQPGGSISPQGLANNIMYKYISVLLLASIIYSAPRAQLKVTCSEKEKKADYGNDPIIVKTCILKNFKFISTSYPDYAGRYFSSESEVFVRVNNKYIKTSNSRVFKRNQAELLALINERIQSDYHSFEADSNTKACFLNMDSIPVYKMDELNISFYEDEIWFEVHWDLPIACRVVDGTIVSFKLKELGKYF